MWAKKPIKKLKNAMFAVIIIAYEFVVPHVCKKGDIT